MEIRETDNSEPCDHDASTVAMCPDASTVAMRHATPRVEKRGAVKDKLSTIVIRFQARHMASTTHTGGTLPFHRPTYIVRGKSMM